METMASVLLWIVPELVTVELGIVLVVNVVSAEVAIAVLECFIALRTPTRLSSDQSFDAHCVSPHRQHSPHDRYRAEHGEPTYQSQPHDEGYGAKLWRL